jgi:peptidoglycan/LPS O-acetylase OafA/YrhL
MKSHIIGLDIARFTAAAIVCAFHLTYWGNVSNGSTAEALQGAAWFPSLGVVTRYGWVGVEIFFVISGL